MRFEKAEESLAAARLCQMNGYANSSVSRAYYAAFQAGIVALSAAGVQSGEDGWSHAGLHAAFARELIHRRKLYPANFAHYLLDLITWRLRADYESADITARKAARALSLSNEFVMKVKEVTGS
ncbi:MAG: HEPN domain-containing protein [Sulfobacillus sp.]